MILTLAGVLDKVGLPSHLLLASIPFVLVAVGIAAAAGVKRGWRVWLCLGFALLLGGHIWLLSLLKLIDADIARAVMNEYRYTTGREYDVDMQLAFVGSIVCVGLATIMGFVIGRFVSRSRLAKMDSGA